MGIRLADLGEDFSVEPLNEGNAVRARASNGTIRIPPGVYLLRRAGVTGGEWKTAALTNRIGLGEFFALPGKDAPVVVRHEPASGWVGGKPLPLSFTVAGAGEPEEASLEFVAAGAPEPRRLPVKRERAYHYAATVPASWLASGQARYRLALRIAARVEGFPTNAPGAASNAWWQVPVLPRAATVPLFEANRHSVKPQAPLAWKQSLVPGMTAGRRAARLAVEKFGPPPSSISFRNELAEELEPWRDLLASRAILRVRARGLEPSTQSVEVVLLERDGSAWGANVPLTPEWRDARVPLASLRHFAHWGGSPPGRGGAADRLRPQEIAGVSVCFGAWLYPNHAAEPHTVDIESIAVE